MATLSLNEIRARLALFTEKWKDASDEDADGKSFWDDLFTSYGTMRRQVAKFEVPVTKLDGNKGFIDLLWKGKVIVEHKSRGKDLGAAKGQAVDYMERLKPAERPRFLVTCDFARFQVFDLHSGHEEHFKLEELPAKAEAMGFLGGYEPKRPSIEAPVNIEAVERLGQLYDAMKEGGYPDHDLQAFLVRVLFCLFSEDTGVFEPDAFTDIIVGRTAEDGADLGIKLAQIFETLDAVKGKRQKALDEAIAGLPYVNGKLFAGRLSLAATDAKMRQALIGCTDFDWSKISPAIFGSLFQGVMDSAERRAVGAHYTSEENILKVIRPLFLDALRAEFAAIKNGPKYGREQKLEAFHTKLSKLKFLDPACGCGNFLIITYREIRRIEIELLKELHPTGQQIIDISILSKIDVDQFYGIEIDEFPSQIARVALWLMDHVMNVELGYALGQAFTRLPLTKSANIVNGNALRIDWREVISPEECSYIFGNPPFIGHQWRTAEQMEDMASIWGTAGRFGRLDYVTCWYKKAAEFIHDNSHIQCAFVSTNSITQGEQVGILWAPLFEHGIKILFAHRTFPWISEARGMAHVHVVIIGFGLNNQPKKNIFDYDNVPSGQNPTCIEYANISPYLIGGPDLILPSRTEPRPGMPVMKKGSQPTDGGGLILSGEEKELLLSQDPEAGKWLRSFVGGEELINGGDRWCLWLKGVSPAELRKHPRILERISKVREARLKSPTRSVREFSEYPTLFTQDRQPDQPYLAIPEVSSESRKYIPICFLTPEVVGSNKLQIIIGGGMWHFGVLSSSIHMAWVKVVGGRLKSDYSYSPAVYNNFPWPDTANASQVKAVEEAAKAVLDARAKYPECSLADLYDPSSTPPELVKAHAALDTAVEKCYRPAPFRDDRERVEFLFQLYERITAPLAPSEQPKKKRKKV